MIALDGSCPYLAATPEGKPLAIRRDGRRKHVSTGGQQPLRRARTIGSHAVNAGVWLAERPENKVLTVRCPHERVIRARQCGEPRRRIALEVLNPDILVALGTHGKRQALTIGR